MDNGKNNVVLEVMNPRGILPADPPTGLSAPRPESLNGKRFLLIPHKPVCNLFFNELEKVLSEEYAEVSFVRCASGISNDIPPEAHQCDVWLEGVKATGGHRTGLAASLEKIGKPGAVISCDEFNIQRTRECASFGVPGIRQIGLSTYDFFICESKPEKLRKIVKDNLNAIINALTSPLTDEEKNPKPFLYDYSNLRFEGNTYTEACESFQQYCVDNDLGDGLPVTPPTQEAVKCMLTGTRRSPDELLGQMQPRNGAATIEKVAINAVMAGAKPEYFPVIIAAVECCLDNRFDFYHVSTGSLASRLLLVVNGPLTKEIGMNSGMGFLGPGNRPNNTIGRAVNICMINIGWGFFKTECGFQGQPERYTNVIFAENEDASPWESYAVEYGYAPTDNTVTIDECTYTDRLGPGGGMNFAPLEMEMARMVSMLKGSYPGLVPDKAKTGRMQFSQDVESLVNMNCFEFALHPTFAKQLSDAGYTKHVFKQWLCDQSRISWDEFSSTQQEALLEVAKKGSIPILTVDDCKSGGMIPTVNPNRISLFVAGGYAGQTMGFYGGGAGAMFAGGKDISLVTKKITGAALTESGK